MATSIEELRAEIERLNAQVALLSSRLQPVAEAEVPKIPHEVVTPVDVLPEVVPAVVPAVVQEVVPDVVQEVTDLEQPLPDHINCRDLQSGKTVDALNEILLLWDLNARIGRLRFMPLLRVMALTSAMMKQWYERVVDFFKVKGIGYEVYCISSGHPQNTIEEAMVSLLTGTPKMVIIMSNTAQDAKCRRYNEFAADNGILVRGFHDESDVTVTLKHCPRNFNGGNHMMSATRTDKMDLYVSDDAVCVVSAARADYNSFADTQFRVWGKVKGESKGGTIRRMMDDPHFATTVQTRAGEKTRNIKIDAEKTNRKQDEMTAYLKSKNFVVFEDNQKAFILEIPGCAAERLSLKHKPLNEVMSDTVRERGLREPGRYAGVCYISGAKGGRGETLHDSGMRGDRTPVAGNIFTDVIPANSANEQTRKQRAGRVCGNIKNALDYPEGGCWVHVVTEKQRLELVEHVKEVAVLNDPTADPSYRKRRAKLLCPGSKRSRAAPAVSMTRTDYMVVLREQGISRIRFRDVVIDFKDDVLTAGDFSATDLYAMTQMLAKAAKTSLRYSVWNESWVEKDDAWCRLSTFQLKPKRVVAARKWKTERNLAQLCAQHSITEVFFTKNEERYTVRCDGAVFTCGDFSDKSLILVCDHIVQKQGKDIWQDCSFFNGVAEVPLQAIRRPA